MPLINPLVPWFDFVGSYDLQNVPESFLPTQHAEAVRPQLVIGRDMTIGRLAGHAQLGTWLASLMPGCPSPLARAAACRRQFDRSPASAAAG